MGLGVKQSHVTGISAAVVNFVSGQVGVGVLDGLSKGLPDFFSLSTAGTPESCMYETMCGPKVRLAQGQWG